MEAQGLPEVRSSTWDLAGSNQLRHIPWLCSLLTFRHSVAYSSLQPCGLEPARLLCPRDVPGKNAGVPALSRSYGRIILFKVGSFSLPSCFTLSTPASLK